MQNTSQPAGGGPGAQQEARFAQQLKKGVLEMLVLELLARQPSHGYELLLRLKQTSGGFLELKEGTLYPILYRLEDDGCIASAWQAAGEAVPQKQRPKPRKVYTVTEWGRQSLAGQWGAWRQLCACVEQFDRKGSGSDE